MTGTGEFETFAHIPFEFVLERALVVLEGRRPVSRLRPVGLTDGALGGGSGLMALRIKEPTHDIQYQEFEPHRRILEKASRMEALENFLNYKMKWSEEIVRCERAGLPDPAPLPHPDDVILDFRVGTVAIRGPLTKEEKVEWDKRIQRRSDAQSEVSFYAGKFRKARDPEIKERWLFDWHLEQRIFDLINDSLPERYKAKLIDRSFRDGASREGTTLSEYVRDRQKPKHKRQWS